MLFEIGFAQKTAVRLHERVDLVRDLAFVKSVPAFFADQAQRLRQRRILENVAFRRRAPFAVERVSFEKGARQILCKVRGPNASKRRSARVTGKPSSAYFASPARDRHRA